MCVYVCVLGGGRGGGGGGGGGSGGGLCVVWVGWGGGVIQPARAEVADSCTAGCVGGGGGGGGGGSGGGGPGELPFLFWAGGLV